MFSKKKTLLNFAAQGRVRKVTSNQTLMLMYTSQKYLHINNEITSSLRVNESVLNVALSVST